MEETGGLIHTPEKSLAAVWAVDHHRVGRHSIRERCYCAGKSSRRLNQGGSGGCGWIWVLSEGSWQDLLVGCVPSVRQSVIQDSPESWDSWLRNHYWLRFLIWKKEEREEKVIIESMLVK